MFSRNPDISKSHRFGVRGFSMVELVAVMAILAAIAVIAGSMFVSGPSPALRMQAGVAEAGSLFNQARALAQARGAPVRILISRDEDDPKKNNRFMLVTVLELGKPKKAGEPEEPAKWQPVGNGIYLPQGIFHVPTSEHVVLWDPVSRLDDEAKGKPWTSYGFGSSGHGGGGSFLLTAGARPPGGDETFADGASVDGFLVRRNGYLTFFESADQVKQYMEEQRRK